MTKVNTPAEDFIAGSSVISFSQIRSSFAGLFCKMEGADSPIKNTKIDNSFIFYSGLNFSFLNQASIFDKSSETLEKIMSVVASWKLPNQIRLGGAGLVHADYLQNLGYKLSAATPVMVYEIDGRYAEFELKDGFKVVRTQDQAQLKLNIEMISSTFGISEDVVKSYTATLNQDPDTFRYILYKNGVPVNSSCFVKDGDFVGCFDVVTPAEHQRNGYGEELMKYMLKEQFNLGSKLVVLQSSAAGEKLYRRLGFKVIEYEQSWEFDSPA